MLRFGTFAKLIKTATGEKNNEETVNNLLGCVIIPLKIENKKKDGLYYLVPGDCSNLVNGKRNILEDIQIGAKNTIVKNKAEGYFQEKVVKKIEKYPEEKRKLLENIQKELEKDEVLSEEQKNQFFALLKEETLAKGLSELCLYLLTQPNKLEDIEALIEAKRKRKPEISFYTANEDYAKGFTRTLFLHREKNDLVTLENLYVWQDYAEKNEDRRSDLQSRIGLFCAEPNQKLLIIEGDAGTGKSTLVQCINYHYKKQDSEADKMLHGRILVTVRLRDFTVDMKGKAAEKNILFPALAEYLNLSEDEIIDAKGKYVFLLDGFDELCTSDSKIDSHEIIRNLQKHLTGNAKMIITTRPDYVRNAETEHDLDHRVSGNTFGWDMFGSDIKGTKGKEQTGYKKIILQHYSPEQRAEWLKKYTTICKEDVAKYILKHLNSIGKEKSIFDVPLNLYMIAASRPEKKLLENTWSLYRFILHEAIRENRGSWQTASSGVDTAHPESKNWEVYYRICEEIAYKMYAEQKESVNSEDIKSIIAYLKEEMKEKMTEDTFLGLEKHCHVLCGFWKADPGSETFEFYHNDIRDFFICEKIYRELNCNYQKQERCEGKTNNAERILDESREELAKKAAKALAKLFQFGRFEQKVLDFLGMRASCGFSDGEEKDFSMEECYFPLEQQFYPYVSQIMVTNDRIYPEQNKVSLYAQMAATVKSMWETFVSIYQPLLEEGERIHFWGDVEKVNEKGILKYLFMEKADHLLLRNVDLRGIALPQAYLRKARLEGSDLSGAELTNADLTFARLDGCKIEQTDFNGAHLNGVEPEILRQIREMPELRWADFTGSRTQEWKKKLMPGSLYEFGHDPLSPGGREKILWRVLDIQDGAALLLADQVLIFKEYENSWDDITWKESELCIWLNEDSKACQENYEESFLMNAFSEKERERIARRKVEALHNPHSRYRNTNPGEEILEGNSDQRNRIFLLNNQEVMKYFASKGYEQGVEDEEWIDLGGEQAVASATGYAIKEVLDIEIDREYLTDAEGNCWWWLRSPGDRSYYAACVNPSGRVCCGGDCVDDEDIGVRPALWLKLDESEI